MAFLSITDLPTVVRSASFSQSFTVEPDGFETIGSVTCTSVLPLNPGITISVLLGVITISGQYTGLFDDMLTYVEKGSSDRLMTPITVIGTGSIPADKDLFDFSQDLTDSISVQYKVSCTVDGGPIDLFISQTVKNDWTFGGTWLTGYLS